MSITGKEVPLDKAIRLINHGPIVLISAAHGGRRSVMTAAWTMPLDFNPPKLIVIVNAASYTRELLEASGEFAVNVPPRCLLKELMAAGASSGRDVEDKFAVCGLKSFPAEKISAPLVEDCVGWLECKLLRSDPEDDLFVGEVVSAHADSRVFGEDGWQFEKGPEQLRTLHHAGGGTFYADGEKVGGD